MSKKESGRREFLKASAGAALVAGAVLTRAHAAEKNEIKVGVIGCGGRGRGAAENVLHASPNVKIVAMADVFEDRLKSSLSYLTNKTAKMRKVKELGNTIDVPQERQFKGLNAYKELLATYCNYVILATPPGFLPMMLEAAVAAGKNIFTEKPVGVDPVGIRKVLKVAEEAKKKNLAIVAGTQRRHQTSYLEAMKKIQGGEIGDVVAARCYWNQGKLWSKPQEKEWSDLEWHIRNWLYFTWLSGDHIVEQHIHNIDVMNWGIGSHPLKAVGLGGRQQRTAPVYGHIYDHFAVDFEYPNGVHGLSMCRQIPDTAQNVSESFVGTKGDAFLKNRPAPSGKTRSKINGKRVTELLENKPYEQEHTDLIESIRKGAPLNELKRVAESTLTAIMGRLACYTGKEVTWDFLLNKSTLNLMPKELSWTAKMKVDEVAIPGVTKLV